MDVMTIIFCRETNLNGASTVGAVYDRPNFADQKERAVTDRAYSSEFPSFATEPNY